MARIRSIKPEFPQSETIGKLSREARLFFILLWTVVDDEGRSRAASRMLASLLYPYDDDAPDLIDGWIAELERENCIRRYRIDNAIYLEVVNWLKHQKIDRPSASRLPECREGSSIAREDSRTLDADLGPRTLDLGPRIKDHSRAVARATRPRARRSKAEAAAVETIIRFDEFWQTYPHRLGSNPKYLAREKFVDLVEREKIDPGVIIAGAKRYAVQERANVNTQFIAQASTWLNQHRWENEDAPPPNGTGSDRVQSRSLL